MPAAVPIAMVGSSIVGGVMASKSAKKASQAQGAATDKSIAAQNESDARYYAQQEKVRQALSPYVQAGYQSIGYSPQQAQQFSGSTGGSNPNIPQGAREKPSFGGAVMNDQGTVVGSSGAQGTFRTGGDMPTTSTFASGYNTAQPALEEYIGVGQTAMPQMQNYAEGGMNAYNMQQDIAGVNGPEAQQLAYEQVENDPATQYMMEKAKTGILSGGSATGNLGSGRMTNALMEYQPEILTNAINQKYGMLAPMAASGANTSQYLMGTGGNVAQNLYGTAQSALENTASRGLSAAGGTPISQAGGSPIASLINQGGAIQAGSQLAQGNAMVGALNSGVSNYFTAKQMGMFNGGGGGGGGNDYSNYSGPDYSGVAPMQPDYANYSGPNYGGGKLQANIVL